MNSFFGIYTCIANHYYAFLIFVHSDFLAQEDGNLIMNVTFYMFPN